MRLMTSLWYSTLMRQSYRAEIPVSSCVPAGMKAGVTAASRALNRPSKSVKYLVVSASTLNLTPALTKSTHVKDKVSKLGTIHKPFPGRLNDPPHLFIVPLRNLVSNEQRLV